MGYMKGLAKAFVGLLDHPNVDSIVTNCQRAGELPVTVLSGGQRVRSLYTTLAGAMTLAYRTGMKPGDVNVATAIALLWAVHTDVTAAPSAAMVAAVRRIYAIMYPEDQKKLVQVVDDVQERCRPHAALAEGDADLAAALAELREPCFANKVDHYVLLKPAPAQERQPLADAFQLRAEAVAELEAQGFQRAEAAAERGRKRPREAEGSGDAGAKTETAPGVQHEKSSAVAAVKGAGAASECAEPADTDARKRWRVEEWLVAAECEKGGAAEAVPSRAAAVKGGGNGAAVVSSQPLDAGAPLDDARAGQQVQTQAQPAVAAPQVEEPRAQGQAHPVGAAGAPEQHNDSALSTLSQPKCCCPGGA